MDDIRMGTCPLCSHHEVIEAELQETNDKGIPSPLPVSWGPRPGSTRWEPVGLLKAYVCRRCGHTALFTDSPERIPIGRAHRTRLVEGTKRPGPYR